VLLTAPVGLFIKMNQVNTKSISASPKTAKFSAQLVLALTPSVLNRYPARKTVINCEHDNEANQIIVILLRKFTAKMQDFQELWYNIASLTIVAL
jgi:hypothetical protein